VNPAKKLHTLLEDYKVAFTAESGESLTTNGNKKAFPMGRLLQTNTLSLLSASGHTLPNIKRSSRRGAG
jgi:hypothetical protein